MKRNFFLDHPVFSIVLSIVIVLLGCIEIGRASCRERVSA